MDGDLDVGLPVPSLTIPSAGPEGPDTKELAELATTSAISTLLEQYTRQVERFAVVRVTLLSGLG